MLADCISMYIWEIVNEIRIKQLYAFPHKASPTTLDSPMLAGMANNCYR